MTGARHNIVLNLALLVPFGSCEIIALFTPCLPPLLPWRWWVWLGGGGIYKRSGNENFFLGGGATDGSFGFGRNYKCNMEQLIWIWRFDLWLPLHATVSCSPLPLPTPPPQPAFFASYPVAHKRLLQVSFLQKTFHTYSCRRSGGKVEGGVVRKCGKQGQKKKNKWGAKKLPARRRTTHFS